MARNYSTTYKQAINETGGAEIPLLLLEIDHSGLSVPVRVVNDTQDLVSNGNAFTAMGFRYVLPDDLEQGNVKARIAVDNVGRDLVQWLEESYGGAGATVRMMQVLRSDPDTIEWEVTMDLTNVNQNVVEVSGELGFNNLLDQPAVLTTYRPDVAPGLY